MNAVKVSVGTTATLLLAAGRGTVDVPQSVVLSVPSGGSTVYIGGENVTTASGFPVVAGATLSLDVIGEPVYGIVGASTQDVNVLRSGS